MEKILKLAIAFRSTSNYQDVSRYVFEVFFLLTLIKEKIKEGINRRKNSQKRTKAHIKSQWVFRLPYICISKRRKRI